MTACLFGSSLLLSKQFRISLSLQLPKPPQNHKPISLEQVLDETDDRDERKRAGRNALDAGTALKGRGDGAGWDAGWDTGGGRDNAGDGRLASGNGDSWDGHDRAGRDGHGGRAGGADGAGDGGGQDGAGLALGDDGWGNKNGAGGSRRRRRRRGRGVGGQFDAQLLSAGLGVESLGVQLVFCLSHIEKQSYTYLRAALSSTKTEGASRARI